jgi:hypothetical protein
VSHVLDALPSCCSPSRAVDSHGTLVGTSQPLAAKTQRQMPKTVLKRV